MIDRLHTGIWRDDLEVGTYATRETGVHLNAVLLILCRLS